MAALHNLKGLLSPSIRACLATTASTHSTVAALSGCAPASYVQTAGLAEVATGRVDELHPAYRAVLIDAAGTLLIPSEPAAQVYLRYASRYGVSLSEDEVLHRFRRAYNTPWGHSHIRYVGDGRPFWQYIVSESLGCNNTELFEQIYDYYARAEAWKTTDGAPAALRRLRDAGIKLAIVSNFDTRLRPILHALGLSHLFDAVIISAELGVEKPNPLIFEAACAALGVAPEQTVHVGDDRRNDLYGARDAGCYAWLWGLDVTSFDQIANRVLGYDSDDE